MARSRVTRFGPGSLESLTLRVWHKGRSAGRVLCARLDGSHAVYCGNGWRHDVEISERVEVPAHGDVTDELTLWTRATWQGETLAAESLAALLVDYALEDWDDPCTELETLAE